MRILLTNDDGIYAPGLAAMERQLRNLGDVTVASPLTEQSGVGHAITYLTPLMAREVFTEDQQPRGWAVEGSPADCVKLAVCALLPERPDLLVSGINSGMNAGINVLYSGTVAAAIEGAFFGITSIAVSLEYHEAPRYDVAAEMAAGVIKQLLAQPNAAGHLYNLNIPMRALTNPAEVKFVSMATAPWGEHFQARLDPRGRPYYWANGLQPDPPPGVTTDLSELRAGNITITPLNFDMTDREQLAEMRDWRFGSLKPLINAHGR
jgi:5'-nucleotidase